MKHYTWTCHYVLISTFSREKSPKTLDTVRKLYPRSQRRFYVATVSPSATLSILPTCPHHSSASMTRNIYPPGELKQRCITNVLASPYSFSALFIDIPCCTTRSRPCPSMKMYRSPSTHDPTHALNGKCATNTKRSQDIRARISAPRTV